ncbi:MAG: DUF1559 domain-containing protein [Planctomycetaceae bacterium]|nr:DUF1559 domain-containing protein [Planctomycetaceae bacterium]
MVELLVVIAIIGVLIALLLPAVQAAREAARRMQCTNKLKQIALGLHNYHDTLNTFPPLGIRSTSAQSSYRRGWRTFILPFIEQNAIADMIAGGGVATSAAGNPSWASQPGGVDKVPWDTDYLPWFAYIDVYRCPSDGNAQGKIDPGTGTNNPASYRGCVGDLEWPWAGTPFTNFTKTRGVFDDIGRNMSAITDGTSNTLLLSETLVNSREGSGKSSRGNLGLKMVPDHTPQSCIANLDTTDRKMFLPSVNASNNWFGRRWADAAVSQSGFNASLPPNAPSCSWSSDTNSCIVAPSSYHSGGVNCAKADGSISFFSDTIDTGDISQTANVTVQEGSPYGVWGALGSVNAGD